MIVKKVGNNNSWKFVIITTAVGTMDVEVGMIITGSIGMIATAVIEVGMITADRINMVTMLVGSNNM